MTTAGLLGIIAALFLVSIAIHAIHLFLAARILRIRGPGAARILAGAAAIVLLASIVGAAHVLDPRLERPPAVQLAVFLLAVLAGLIILKRALRSSWMRASAALIILLGLSFAEERAGLFELPRRWIEGYSVETGSSAPALRGVHLLSDCPSCGAGLAAGIPGGGEWRPQVAPAAPCEACGTTVRIPPDSPRRSGDRILVDSTSTPERWDLVAYREPHQGSIFANRLVGLPGESIEIVDGDLFADGKRIRRPPGSRGEMWIPVAAIDSRTNLSPVHETPRGWRRVDGRPPGEARYELERTVDDSFSYLALHDARGVPRRAARPVHDIRIEAEIAWVKELGSGERFPAIALEWSRAGRTARAEVDKTCEFLLLADGKEARGRFSPRGLTGPIALEVRDGTAALLADGRVVAALDVGAGDLESARKAPAGMPCACAIESLCSYIVLDRLAVLRDVHYREDIGDASWPLVLGPGESLILGDSPHMAFDGRFGVQRPVKEMQGVVRWTYGPLGRWRAFD